MQDLLQHHLWLGLRPESRAYVGAGRALAALLPALHGTVCRGILCRVSAPMGAAKIEQPIPASSWADADPDGASGIPLGGTGTGIARYFWCAVWRRGAHVPMAASRQRPSSPNSFAMQNQPGWLEGLHGRHNARGGECPANGRAGRAAGELGSYGHVARWIADVGATAGR
jgi:hypothetical protein